MRLFLLGRHDASNDLAAAKDEDEEEDDDDGRMDFLTRGKKEVY